MLDSPLLSDGPVWNVQKRCGGSEFHPLFSSPRTLTPNPFNGLPLEFWRLEGSQFYILWCSFLIILVWFPPVSVAWCCLFMAVAFGLLTARKEQRWCSFSHGLQWNSRHPAQTVELSLDMSRSRKWPSPSEHGGKVKGQVTHLWYLKLSSWRADSGPSI